MRLLLNAGTGLALAWVMGLGSFAGLSAPSLNAVRADLAAARPLARLAAQADAIFSAAGMPRPAPDLREEM